MSLRKISTLLLYSLFLSSAILAQDSIPSTYDESYREDQFYIGITYNIVTDVPGSVATRGLSGGLQFGFLRDMPINEQRNVAVAIGLGMAFDRFGQTLFIGEDDNDVSIFGVLDDGIDYNSNRFSTAAVEAPIEFRWRSSTSSSYKFWRMYGGFKVGYVYWYKASFRQDNNDINQTKISEFDRLRLGANLSFGYNTFNFYVYYSINPFFKDAVTTEGQQVDFRTIKVGLQFYIL